MDTCSAWLQDGSPDLHYSEHPCLWGNLLPASFRRAQAPGAMLFPEMTFDLVLANQVLLVDFNNSLTPPWSSLVKVGYYGSCESNIGNLVSLDCGEESWSGRHSIFPPENIQRWELSSAPPDPEEPVCDQHGKEFVCDLGFNTCTVQCSQSSPIISSSMQWCRCDSKPQLIPKRQIY